MASACLLYDCAHGGSDYMYKCVMMCKCVLTYMCVHSPICVCVRPHVLRGKVTGICVHLCVYCGLSRVAFYLGQG